MSIGNFAGKGWDGSVTDENHIAEALEQLGHTVTRAQREDNLNFTPHPTTPFDFILIAQWDGYRQDMIDMLRQNYSISWRLNTPDKTPKIIYWAFDYQADGQAWHERLVAEADLYLSKRIADSKYPNWRWLSQDFAPSFLEALPNRTFKDEQQPIDVLFTGSYLPWATERNETLKAVDEKFNLVIHSVNEWAEFKDVRPPIMDEGLPALYKTAKINLAIDHTLETGYWSDRVAQILCCGGFVLNRYVPLMEARFPRDGLIYFYSINDCLQKIERLLEAGPTREVTSSHGRAAANQNLRVSHRVRDLLTIVESL